MNHSRTRLLLSGVLLTGVAMAAAPAEPQVPPNAMMLVCGTVERDSSTLALTPPLSPGERENGIQRWDEAGARGLSETERHISLSWGRGPG
jgi:hypothetical protein